jgi:hypothetical protein
MRQAKRIGGALVALMMVLSTVWPAVSELGAQTATGSSASGWPQRMAKNGHVVLVHAPQIDSWEQYAKVAFRAAVAVQPRGEAKPTYGVVDVTADTATDFDRRTVVATNIHRELRFPGASAEAAARLAAIYEEVVPLRNAVQVPLDLVLAYVRSSAEQRKVPVSLEAPRIFYSARPAILVMFMGEPKLKPVPGTALMSAVNTNWDVLYDTASGEYYLLNEASWLRTTDPVKGPWVPAKAVPTSFAALPEDPEWTEVKKNIPGRPVATAPAIFVSTQPAEMILTDGAPEYGPVPGTRLLYVSNSSNVVFLHSGEGQYYFLVAGRWFRAKKLTGPWAAASSDLPKDFHRIPGDHPLAPIRASVPGTEQAEDAVLLASVPRTVEVKVGEAARAAVVYNGAPKFEPVQTIAVSYAVNTAYDVFLVSGSYYWLYEAVWYCAGSAQGPWTVCPSVSQAIYQIPVTHPKHNVTYVYVYQAPAAVPATTVTYAYTSGYSGEYVAATGVLMFGAGLLLGVAIADWDHHHYYYGPAFYSYGAHVHYSYAHGGYYGAAHAYGPYGSAGAWRSYNPATGTYARGGYVSGPYGSASRAAAYNPYTGTRAVGGQVSTAYGSAGRATAYNPYTGNWAQGGYRSTSQGTVAGVRTSSGAGAAGWQTSQGSGGVVRTDSGNVYVGKDGEVYKKDADGGWSHHTGGGDWESSSRPQLASSSAQSQGARADQRAGQPSTTQAQQRPGGASGQPSTLESRQSSQSRQPAAMDAGRGQGAAGGARMSSDVQSQLDRDVASRGRSEQMSAGPGSRDFGGGGGRAASGGGSRGGRGRR